MSADAIGRITKVVIHDWRGIKAVEYDIGPGGVVVEGTNGSGKTSFISGIRACLTGRGVDENAIRVGAEQAEIFVDHQHATVRRLLKANGGSSLKVTRDDGTTQASPQAWLNDVLGVSPLDPIDLMEEKDGAKRRARILAAMPIAVSPSVLAQWLPPGETVPEADCKGHGLDVVERVRKLVYERRTEANRVLKSAQAAVTEAGLKLATAEADLGAAPVRAKAVVDEELALAARARADIEARAQLAATTNASADRTRARVADLRAEAAKLREVAGNMTPDATVLTKLIEAKAERTEEIEQHEHSIAQLQSKIAEIEADRENAIRRRAETAEAIRRMEETETEAQKANDAAIDKAARADELEASIAFQAPVSAEEIEAASARVQALRAELERAGKAARVAELRAQSEAVGRERDAAEAKQKALDTSEKALKHDAPKALLAASGGVPGLTVDGDVIRLDGIALDTLSGAEQLRFCVDVARRMNAKSKLLVIDKLEAVAPDQLADFIAHATEGGYQLIATRVSDGPIVARPIGGDRG